MKGPIEEGHAVSGDTVPASHEPSGQTPQAQPKFNSLQTKLVGYKRNIRGAFWRRGAQHSRTCPVTPGARVLRRRWGGRAGVLNTSPQTAPSPAAAASAAAVQSLLMPCAPSLTPRLPVPVGCSFRQSGNHVVVSWAKQSKREKREPCTAVHCFLFLFAGLFALSPECTTFARKALLPCGRQVFLPSSTNTPTSTAHHLLPCCGRAPGFSRRSRRHPPPHPRRLGELRAKDRAPAKTKGSSGLRYVRPPTRAAII